MIMILGIDVDLSVGLGMGIGVGLNVGIRVGLSVGLSVRISLVQDMVFLGVMQGVWIYSCINVPADPNVITPSIKAITTTISNNKKLMRIPPFCNWRHQ